MGKELNMEYFYKAFVNQFHNDMSCEEKEIYTSKNFKKFYECWNYAVQYQNNNGCFIKVFQIDNESKITEMTLEMRQEALKGNTKNFWITQGRERDLIRYSEKSDQKDAKEFTYEEAKKRLIEKSPSYTEKADKFLESVMKSPFNDWIEF